MFAIYHHGLIAKIWVDDMQVWFLGRNLNEYIKMFKLDMGELEGKRILDCNAGASSFTAQMRERGFDVKAADKLYNKSPRELENIAEESIKGLIRSHGEFMDKLKGLFKDKNGLIENRIKTYKIFIKDYEENPDHYIPAELPKLPFKDNEFHLLLSGNLLFLYEETFNYKFHLKSIQEMLRVAQEIRVYPIQNIHKKRRSIYLTRLLKNFTSLEISIEETPYILRDQAREMLKIKKTT